MWVGAWVSVLACMSVCLSACKHRSLLLWSVYVIVIGINPTSDDSLSWGMSPGWGIFCARVATVAPLPDIPTSSSRVCRVTWGFGIRGDWSWVWGWEGGRLMRKGCGGTGIEGDEGDSFGHIYGGSLILIQMRRGLHVIWFTGIYLCNVSCCGIKKSQNWPHFLHVVLCMWQSS